MELAPAHSKIPAVLLPLYFKAVTMAQSPQSPNPMLSLPESLA